MDTIKQYIRNFKDISFEESPFNDVDNAIFCNIVYLDFSAIVTSPITLKEAGKIFFETLDYQKLKTMPPFCKKIIENFEILFTGKRYRNIIISNYVKVVDYEKQFCAMTYHLTNDTMYIAYEGTDDSLIGWKEDGELIYRFPIPSQKMAIDYLNKIVKLKTKKVMVGGHSKGGNLAMTASMYAKPWIRKKIKTVYNNDGPGFQKEQTKTKEYKKMLTKLKMFVPEESFIGLILEHPINYTVIKSNGIGIFQHNLNNWNCYGPIFLKGTLSESSKKIADRIKKWLDTHNNQERKKLIEIIFDTLQQCDITLLSQVYKMNFSRFMRLVKASKNLDKESKDLIINSVKTIIMEEKK